MAAALEYLAGRYRLIERLGTGGMSVVWRAYDEVLGRRVAVKLLAARDAADPDSRERVRAEARAAAKLSHPYITAVHDYGESTAADGSTVPFVVMELVEGEPLDARLADGPLPWRTAAELTAQIAAALAAVHAHGLVHRDVKPANVVLTASGAKLVDFGISAVVGERLDSGTHVFGTPAYLAPERIDGGPVHAASDVYALGLVLYKMVTGRLPWDADTTTQMLTAHCHADPAPLPRGVPDAIVEICRRCLEKDPKRRPGAVEVARVLTAAVGAAPGPRTPAARGASAVPVRLERTVAALSRPRRAMSAGLVAAGVVAVVLALGTCGGPDRPDGRPAQATGPGAAEGGGANGPACRVWYATRSDAAGQFVVDVTVVNSGESPVPDWRLDFEYPGDQRVVDLDGALLQQHGAWVAVLGGTDLAPGATTTVSLTGVYASGNPMPTDFRLSGQDCAGSVVGAADPVAPGAVAPSAAVAEPTGAANHPDPERSRKGKRGKGGGKGED